MGSVLSSYSVLSMPRFARFEWPFHMENTIEWGARSRKLPTRSKGVLVWLQGVHILFKLRKVGCPAVAPRSRTGGLACEARKALSVQPQLAFYWTKVSSL